VKRQHPGLPFLFYALSLAQYWNKAYRSHMGIDQLKILYMLYLIAIILIIGWLLGFFVFSVGGLIHVLLVIAIIAIILRLIQGRNPV
jgi:hypothetical protein